MAVRKSTGLKRLGGLSKVGIRTKDHKLLDVAAALRGWRSAREDHRSQQLRELTPTQAIREMRDGVPSRALSRIRASLIFARSVANDCETILKKQAADLDLDVAVTLRSCVSDELSDQIKQIDRLLAEASQRHPT